MQIEIRELPEEISKTTTSLSANFIVARPAAAGEPLAKAKEPHALADEWNVGNMCGARRFQKVKPFHSLSPSNETRQPKAAQPHLSQYPQNDESR